jgi:hypothetical protein
MQRLAVLQEISTLVDEGYITHGLIFMVKTVAESIWDSAPRYAVGGETPERCRTKAICTLMAESYVNRMDISVNDSLMRLGMLENGLVALV